MFGLSKRMLIVVGTLVVVAVLFFIQDSKKPGTPGTQNTSSSTGTCQVQVTADVLNVRSSPNGSASVVATLHNGAVKTATSTVQNNFRELAPNQWASNQFLKAVSGAC